MLHSLPHTPSDDPENDGNLDFMDNMSNSNVSLNFLGCLLGCIVSVSL